MELLQLKYFCDAAQTENFSRTAEKFSVPVPGVTQSIKRLKRSWEILCLPIPATGCG
jgi:DNA-binding transcriptional LysR family regulator